MDFGWVDEVEDGIVWGRVLRGLEQMEFSVPLRLVSESARVDLCPGSYVTILNGELAVNGAIWTTHDMETADREASDLHAALFRR
jgi:hypothetical protein